jgi:hypothetical protein
MRRGPARLVPRIDIGPCNGKVPNGFDVTLMSGTMQPVIPR